MAFMGNMFPSDFLWGAATAGYQVEGDICNNDWDFFTSDAAIHARVAALGKLASPPEQFRLRPAGPAVHHANLHVLKDDLDRCRALGMNAYRFSVEWSRIEPHPGDLRADVLENYYVQVVREIKARHMEPVLTLHHMTLPRWVLTPSNVNQTLVQAAAKSAVTTGLALAALVAFGVPAALGLAAFKLPMAGESRAFRRSLRGWESAETVDRYIAYVRFVVSRLRDEGVKFWLTLNEPVGSLIGLGYLGGIWPAGFSLDGERAYRAYLHLLKAHVRAYHAIKALQPDAQVSLAHHMAFCKVSTERVLAVRGDNAVATRQLDYFYHQHFLDAVIDGRVDVAIQHEPARRRYVDSQQFFGIAPSAWQPTLDFIGLNYYRAVYVRHDPLLAVVAGRFWGGVPKTNEAPSMQHNDLGWEVFPEGLYTILKQLASRYNLAILITENGMAEAVDKHRASYIISHVQQVQRARQRRGRRHRLPALVDRGQLRVGVSVRSPGTVRSVPCQPDGPRDTRWELSAAHDGRGARHAGRDRHCATQTQRPGVSGRTIRVAGTSWGQCRVRVHCGRARVAQANPCTCCSHGRRWTSSEACSSIRACTAGCRSRPCSLTPAKSTLSFSHPAQGTMPARRFEATVTGR